MSWYNKSEEESEESRVKRVTNDLDRYGIPATDLDEDWVRERIEADRVPYAWKGIVTKRIRERGRPPYWAESWVKEKMIRGEGSPDWIEEANKIIREGKNPGDWFHEWAKGILESGQLPEGWMEGIQLMMRKWKEAIPWYREWINNKFWSEDYPPEWEKIIIDEFNKHPRNPFEYPVWAEVWYIKKVESEEIPPEWWRAFGRFYNYTAFYGGHYPPFKRIMKEKLKKDNPPEQLVLGLMERFAEEGRMPNWIYEDSKILNMLWHHPMRKKIPDANVVFYARRIDQVIWQQIRLRAETA